MNRRYVLILFILLLCGRAFGQTETYYPGTIIPKAATPNGIIPNDGPYPIGFNFTFFGNTYSDFYVSANGLIMFVDPGAGYGTEASIPTATAPNNYIAPFWDDLIIDGTGNITYTTVGASPNRKLIVQFINMGFYPLPPYFGAFAVILYENLDGVANVIKVQYRLIVDYSSKRAHGESATIGIENADGSAGVQYAYHDTLAIATKKAISFTPDGSTYKDTISTYDPVFLTTNFSNPEPGITNLISPPQDAIIGSDYTFEWDAASNATNYSLKISNYSDLTDAVSYNAGTNLTYDISGLILDTTYYWGVFASNATGLTWCELKKFTTSSTPPLVGVPREVWVSQGDAREGKLQYSGGDASAKTATVTSLPLKGHLYQVSGGSMGDLITSVPALVTDPEFSLIYLADGGTGNGAGSFNFKFHDDTGDSPEATITINVSPAGIPNFINAARNTTVEVQFDIPMNSPSGKQDQFTVTVNGSSAPISSAALKTGDPYTIVLTLGTPLIATDTVFVSYTKGTISATTGGLLESFTDQPVTLLAQTITFNTSLSKKYLDPPFNLSATTPSGLPFTFSSSNMAVATISGITVTIHTVGTSDITARQAGNTIYAPARYIKTLTVAKADQTISFGLLSDKTFGDGDYTISATSSSGLSVAFASDNSAVATVTGTLVHIAGAGTAVITASQPGNSLYAPAASVPQNLIVNKANQTISFGALSDKTYGDADYTISATSSSGLSVSFTSDNSAVATVTGTLVHIIGGGNAVITASQTGNTNYNAAPEVTQDLTINKASLTVTAENKTKEYLAPIPLLTLAYSGFLNSDDQSVLDLLPSVATTATISSPVGDYDIIASGGSDNSYNFIFTDGILSITKIAQTITFTDTPERLLVTDSYTLVASSSAGLPVLFESTNTDIATVSGSLVTGVEKGIVQVRAYNEGDENNEVAEAFANIEVYSTHKDVMYLFTPNNDGFNDLWELPEMATWGNCDVKVYNRWGKLVFADDNYNNTWDGMSDGYQVPEGAYYFVIKTENAGTVKGTVNIVR